MADIFEAIADPARRQLMEVLLNEQLTDGSGELTVAELVEQTGLTQPVVLKHLKVLREVELVAARESGKQLHYSITPDPLEEIEDWMVNFLSLGFDSDADDVEFPQQLGFAGERLGYWLTERAEWLAAQIRGKVAEAGVNVDPAELGRQLGRRLADAKLGATQSAAEFEKVARDRIEEMVDELKSETKHLAEDLKSKVKRERVNDNDEL